MTRPDKPTDSAGHAASQPTAKLRLSWVLTLTATALVIFGAKTLLIAKWGSITPFWDQWDAEAAGLYQPYLNGQLSLAPFFTPHNEHRVLFSRLFSLGLLEAAGEWRPLLQMLLNALLHAGFGVALAVVLARALEPAERWKVALFVAILFALPLGWENTLQGFQWGIYLLLIFSLGAIVAFARTSALSAGWWCGVALCVAAYFSTASGGFVPLAAAVLMAAQFALGVRRGLREAAGIVLLLALTAVLIAYVPQLAHHEPLRAKGVLQFLRAFVLPASWPVPWVGLLLVHVPLAVLAARCLVERPGLRDARWTLIGLGIWAFLQMALLAYGRAVGVTAWRYIDLYMFALPLNLAALLLQLRDAQTFPTAAARRFAQRFALVWVVTIAVFLVVQSGRALKYARERAEVTQIGTQNLMAYLAGDATALRDKPMFHIPYPVAERLEGLLADPDIRRSLPPELLPGNDNQGGIRAKLWTRGRLSGAVLEFERLALARGWVCVLIGLALFGLGWISGRPKAEA